MRKLTQTATILSTGQTIGNIVIFIFLLIICLFLFLPMVWVSYSSFKTNTEIFANAWSLPTHISLQGFISGWSDANMGRTLFNSLITVGTAVVFSLVLSLPAAYAFARMKFNGRDILFIIFLSGLMIPVQATIIPLYAYFHKWNWLDKYQSVIFPYIALGLPFSIFLLRSYFLTLPKELEDAAKIDGCSNFGTFFRIFLPLVKPGIATVVIFVSVLLFNELLIGMLFLTSDHKKTLPVMLYSFYGKHFSNYEMMFSTITMIVLPLIIVFFIFQQQFVKGLTAGSLKE